MPDKKSDKVWAEYDWKRMILYLHSLTSDAQEQYIRLKYNEHAAMKVYDVFLSRMTRLYTDIKPKLVKNKDMEIPNVNKDGAIFTVKDIITIMDEVKLKRRRLKPDHSILIFDVLTQFLEEWGLTSVEAPDQSNDQGIQVGE